MRRQERSAFRRTAYVGVGVGAASLLTLALTTPGSAQDQPFDAGTGTAVALAYKVNPIFGNLSFGITAGEAIAGHQNTGASAQSKAINLGVIGVSLAAEGCNGDDPTVPAERQPQPVVVNSDDPGAADGRSDDLGGAIRMRARATKAPFAEAVTTIDPVGGDSGLFISGGTTRATSGIVDEGVRRARAVTEIPLVSLFDGLVTLEGLRWDALQETGATTTNEGRFSLGSVEVSGTDIPLPPDPVERLRVLEDVLRSLGLTLTPPTSRFEQGIVFVDPLRIGIVPSRLRDTLVQSVLEPLGDTRQELIKVLAELGCNGKFDIIGNNGKTAVTVLDLALGSVSGAGALTVELGGVQATTSEISGFGGLGVGSGLPSLSDLPDVDVPGLDTGSGDFGSTPALPDSGAPLDLGGTGGAPASQPIAEVDGERGGVLLAVAAGGLALLLLTAEADRRKMRQAQREIPLEA